MVVKKRVCRRMIPSFCTEFSFCKCNGDVAFQTGIFNQELLKYINIEKLRSLSTITSLSGVLKDT